MRVIFIDSPLTEKRNIKSFQIIFLKWGHILSFPWANSERYFFRTRCYRRTKMWIFCKHFWKKLTFWLSRYLIVRGIFRCYCHWNNKTENFQRFFSGNPHILSFPWPNSEGCFWRTHYYRKTEMWIFCKHFWKRLIFWLSRDLIVSGIFIETPYQEKET